MPGDEAGSLPALAGLVDSCTFGRLTLCLAVLRFLRASTAASASSIVTFDVVATLLPCWTGGLARFVLYDTLVRCLIGLARSMSMLEPSWLEEEAAV